MESAVGVEHREDFTEVNPYTTDMVDLAPFMTVPADGVILWGSKGETASVKEYTDLQVRHVMALNNMYRMLSHLFTYWSEKGEVSWSRLRDEPYTMSTSRSIDRGGQQVFRVWSSTGTVRHYMRQTSKCSHLINSFCSETERSITNGCDLD